MTEKSWMLGIFMALGLATTGCEGVAEMQAEMIEAATKGNLNDFRSYFVDHAQDQYGNPETMARIALLAKENQQIELSHDHDFIWAKVGGRFVKATGLAVLLQKDGKVLWVSTELVCESSMSVSSGTPFPIDCKISKLNEPRELSISFANAKLILLALSCSPSHQMRELIDEDPTVDPNTPLFQNGPTALAAITSRVLTDTGTPNSCHPGYRLLKWQSANHK